MKILKTGALTALAACLCACGGGDSNGDVAVPIVTGPSPSPSPSPTSSPTPTVSYARFADIKGPQSLDLTCLPVFREGESFFSQSLVYNQQTEDIYYSLPVVGSKTFTAKDQSFLTSEYVSYKQVIDDRSDYLLVRSKFENYAPEYYRAFSIGYIKKRASDYFYECVAGARTKNNDLPLGRVTYKILGADGSASFLIKRVDVTSQVGDSYSINSGTGSVVIEFSKEKVEADITLLGVPASSGQSATSPNAILGKFIFVADFEGQGGTFRGGYTNSEGLDARVAGTLFGRQGAELGAIFTIEKKERDGSISTFEGRLAGAR